MAQEKGVINEQQLEAVFPVALTNGATIECLLDTGFGGTLMLPREFVAANALPIIGSQPIIGVEAHITEVDIAVAEVHWLNDDFSLRVLVSETGEALIGMEMLIDTVVEINFINLTVTITKPDS